MYLCISVQTCMCICIHVDRYMNRCWYDRSRCRCRHRIFHPTNGPRNIHFGVPVCSSGCRGHDFSGTIWSVWVYLWVSQYWITGSWWMNSQFHLKSRHRESPCEAQECARCLAQLADPRPQESQLTKAKRYRVHCSRPWYRVHCSYSPIFSMLFHWHNPPHPHYHHHRDHHFR